MLRTTRAAALCARHIPNRIVLPSGRLFARRLFGSDESVCTLTQEPPTKASGEKKSAVRLRPNERPKPSPASWKRRLTTLDPKKLKLSDWYDLSGQSTITFRSDLPLAPGELEDSRKKPNTTNPFLHSKISYVTEAKISTTRFPFPEGTHGFLYLHREPSEPIYMGEVRFRITSSNDAATFDGGHDLLLPNQDRWHIPLVNIFAVLSCEGLKSLVLKDHPEDAALASWKPATAIRAGTSRIYKFGQPFVVDANDNRFMISIIGPNVGSVALDNVLIDARDMNHRRPYKGPMTLAFEGPNSSHNIGRSVSIRVVDAEKVEPIEADYDGHVSRPVTGSLLGRKLPWKCNVDSATVRQRDLRFLFQEAMKK